MFTSCPYLVVPMEELTKIKPEHHEEVQADAEKCIEVECKSYLLGECTRKGHSIAKIKIGYGGYQPPKEYMLEPENK